jgi:hypothetical protein
MVTLPFQQLIFERRETETELCFADNETLIAVPSHTDPGLVRPKQKSELLTTMKEYKTTKLFSID